MTLLDPKKVKFTEIYSDYYQMVYGKIYSKTSSATDTNDLTQEVFMIFYSKMDDIENPYSWLVSTINNVLLNYYKSKKHLNNADISKHLNDPSISFVNGLREARMVIDEAVGNLNEQDRILFDLIAVQNLTYGKAAQHLGSTKRQVTYRYSLIIKNIRSFLSERGIKNIEDLL
jgi:RNA polymerase sigma factor (sigma-70 family)